MNPNFYKSVQETPSFKNQDEEIKFLREQIGKQNELLKSETGNENKEKATENVIKAYSKIPEEDVLHASYSAGDEFLIKVFKKLKPEEHDDTLKKIFDIVKDKGVKNAMVVVNEMHNSHIEDDFHKFLTRYIHEYDLPDVKPKSELYNALHMKLFELTLPGRDEADKRTYKELLQAMEQFYMSMQVLSSEKYKDLKQYFTIEIAQSNESKEAIFYFCVPDEVADMFEKQIISSYHDAKIREMMDDYNVFIDGGFSSCSSAKFVHEEVFPIRMHDTFDYDPMNAILSTFSKLEKVGEGAAIQFVVYPTPETKYNKKFKDIIKKLKDGKKLKEALDDWHEFKKESMGMLKGFFGSSDTKDKDEKKIDDESIKKIEEKIKWSVLPINIRIVASAKTKERADEIIQELKATFYQFNDSVSNGLEFKDYKGSDQDKFNHEFIFRNFNEEIALPCNIREITTLMHLPFGVESSSTLKEAKAGIAPAPLNMGTEGILIGINDYRGEKTEIHFRKEDRMRHFYVMGQTGTGKTYSLLNMIRQDIINGDGVCYIDPHGTDIQTILSFIPKERLDDVIYFDPAYTARPMALNMLEYDVRFPEQKSIVIDTLMMIFNQLFSKESMGPQFEQYFKNAAFLVMDDPESGSTLLEITRVFTDKAFRDFKLSKCKNPIVKNFWVAAESTTGESGLQNYVPYITSKFDQFISNEFLRPIILQQKSTFNFRDIMDTKKIFLVNLSKGRLGEMNANLIGMLCVMKFQMAALSRVDSYGQKLEDFFLYIDEFQNVTTPAISSILSEARKYRLSLNVAHQYLAQLPDDIRNAVFGNVGSMAIFRISPEDAKVLEPKFAPTFTSDDIIKIDNYNAYVSMIVEGQPTIKPFNMTIPKLPDGNKDIIDDLKKMSYLRFGEDRQIVEDEIFGRYNK